MPKKCKIRFNKNCQEIIINGKKYYASQQDAQATSNEKAKPAKRHNVHINTRMWHLYMKQNMAHVKSILKLLEEKGYKLGRTKLKQTDKKSIGDQTADKHKEEIKQCGEKKGMKFNRLAMCVLGAHFQNGHNETYKDKFTDICIKEVTDYASLDPVEHPEHKQKKADIEGEKYEQILNAADKVRNGDFKQFFATAAKQYEDEDKATMSDTRAILKALKWEIRSAAEEEQEDTSDDDDNVPLAKLPTAAATAATTAAAATTTATKATTATATAAATAAGAGSGESKSTPAAATITKFKGLWVGNPIEFKDIVSDKGPIPAIMAKINSTLKNADGLSKVSIKLIDETTYSDENLDLHFKKLCTQNGEKAWPMPVAKPKTKDFTIETFTEYKAKYMGNAPYKAFVVEETVKSKKGKETIGMLILKKLAKADLETHFESITDNDSGNFESITVQAAKAKAAARTSYGVSLDVVCSGKPGSNLGKYLVEIGTLYADNLNGNVLTTLEATANKIQRDDDKLLRHYNKFMPGMGFTFTGEKFYRVPEMVTGGNNRQKQEKKRGGERKGKNVTYNSAIDV